jgi:hypothetical protein
MRFFDCIDDEGRMSNGRSLDSRLQKVELELRVGEHEKPTAVDPEKEARRAALSAAIMLAGTMSPGHWQIVRGDVEGMKAGTMGRMSILTHNFLTRSARYVKGDKRPLTLPPEVASQYLVRRHRYEIVDRECLSCGYDVIDTLAELRLPRCPICGGSYEPIETGEGMRFSRLYRGWSKANPDKVADVYVRENGAIAW